MSSIIKIQKLMDPFQQILCMMNEDICVINVKNYVIFIKEIYLKIFMITILL